MGTRRDTRRPSARALDPAPCVYPPCANTTHGRIGPNPLTERAPAASGWSECRKGTKKLVESVVRDVAGTASPSHGGPKGSPTARRRVLIASGAGTAVGAGLAFSPAAVAAPLVGWVVAAAVFVVWTWLEIWPQGPAETAAHARREDPSRPVADLGCLSAAVASLVAVGILLVSAGNAKGATKLLEIGLSIAAVAAAWSLVHTIFTLRYARTYFSTGECRISFNDDDPPRYSDFAYVAMTVGLTFQISDTDLQSHVFRRLVIRHMLLSYLMGAVFVAITINLVAGMSK